MVSKISIKPVLAGAFSIMEEDTGFEPVLQNYLQEGLAILCDTITPILQIELKQAL